MKIKRKAINYSVSETPITPAITKPPPARPVSLSTLTIEICIKSGLNRPGMCTVKTTNKRTRDKIRQVVFVYFLRIMLTEAVISIAPIKYTQIVPNGKKDGKYCLYAPALIIWFIPNIAKRMAYTNLTGFDVRTFI